MLKSEKDPRPCGWCGDIPIVIYHFHPTVGASVMCPCGARGPWDARTDRAIQLWNMPIEALSNGRFLRANPPPAKRERWWVAFARDNPGMCFAAGVLAGLVALSLADLILLIGAWGRLW